jgi:hypothetical protein
MQRRRTLLFEAPSGSLNNKTRQFKVRGGLENYLLATNTGRAPKQNLFVEVRFDRILAPTLKYIMSKCGGIFHKVFCTKFSFRKHRDNKRKQFVIK